MLRWSPQVVDVPTSLLVITVRSTPCRLFGYHHSSAHHQYLGLVAHFPFIERPAELNSPPHTPHLSLFLNWSLAVRYLHSMCPMVSPSFFQKLSMSLQSPTSSQNLMPSPKQTWASIHNPLLSHCSHLPRHTRCYRQASPCFLESLPTLSQKGSPSCARHCHCVLHSVPVHTHIIQRRSQTPEFLCPGSLPTPFVDFLCLDTCAADRFRLLASSLVLSTSTEFVRQLDRSLFTSAASRIEASSDVCAQSLLGLEWIHRNARTLTGALMPPASRKLANSSVHLPRNRPTCGRRLSRSGPSPLASMVFSVSTL